MLSDATYQRMAARCRRAPQAREALENTRIQGRCHAPAHFTRHALSTRKTRRRHVYNCTGSASNTLYRRKRNIQKNVIRQFCLINPPHMQRRSGMLRGSTLRRTHLFSLFTTGRECYVMNGLAYAFRKRMDVVPRRVAHRQSAAITWQRWGFNSFRAYQLRTLTPIIQQETSGS